MQADRRKGAETRRKDESRGNGVAKVVELLPAQMAEDFSGVVGERVKASAEADSLDVVVQGAESGHIRDAEEGAASGVGAHSCGGSDVGLRQSEREDDRLRGKSRKGVVELGWFNRCSKLVRSDVSRSHGDVSQVVGTETDWVPVGVEEGMVARVGDETESSAQG